LIVRSSKLGKKPCYRASQLSLVHVYVTAFSAYLITRDYIEMHLNCFRCSRSEQ